MMGNATIVKVERGGIQVITVKVMDVEVEDDITTNTLLFATTLTHFFIQDAAGQGMGHDPDLLPFFVKLVFLLPLRFGGGILLLAIFAGDTTEALIAGIGAKGGATAKTNLVKLIVG